MTEKRYLYYEEPNGEFPFPYIKRDDGKKIISLYECSELLNSLVDENEQLKQENEKLHSKIFEMRTNEALERTEISKQSYDGYKTTKEFLKELEKW